MPKHENKFAIILHQYNKTKLFRIFYLWCHQQKLKLLAKGIKTIKSKSTIIISIFIIYRVDQKNQTCLSVDNSAMVTCKKTGDMSSFQMQ